MIFTKEEYVKTYEMMYFARRYEEITADHVRRGEWLGLLHLSLGEEAVIVGASAEAGPEDYLVMSLRSKPMFAHRVGVKEFTAEALAKSDGPCRGIAGTSHLVDVKHRIWNPSGMLGQCQGIGVGIALHEKLKKTGNAVIIGVGDGTMNEGHVSEVLNMIAAYKLPVAWYIQNNKYGMSGPQEKVTGLKNLAERARGFGLPAETYDGNDVFLVREVMRDAVEKARQGIPTVNEFICTRWEGHYIGDTQPYRNLEEVKHEKLIHDPVKMCRRVVLDGGYAAEEELQEIERKQEEIIHEACQFAFDSPTLTKEELLKSYKIFAD